MSKKEKLFEEIRGIRRVVINVCHGGFGLSEEAVLRYLELCGRKCWPEYDTKFSSLTGPTYWLVPPGADRMESDPVNWSEMSLAERQAHNQKYSDQVFYDRDIARDDPFLVQVVQELGTDAASGRHAELKVVEIPADVDWEINEYDGAEWVAERHRTWA